MKIKDYEDGKFITLSEAFDERSKILYAFYFISFFSGGTIFLIIFSNVDKTLEVTLCMIICVLACYMAPYRFLNKALMTEQIFVNKRQLKLITTEIFVTSSKLFNISDVSNFRHLEKAELTDHPLAGQTFDYLGFQTEQKVISEMHGDNRLGFDYNGKTILFGQNIYSWQFDELKSVFNSLTDNDITL